MLEQNPDGTFKFFNHTHIACQWVEDKHVIVDNYGVRVLDLSKVGYKMIRG
jgi:hypothetical protein